MYIRRRAKKYECLIRYKGARFQKSFERKTSAVRWGHKSIAELEAGNYVDRDKLFSMQLKDLLQLYFEHVKAQTKRPHLLKYTIDMLCKTSIGKGYLPQIDGVKLSNFKNEMLETRSSATVRKYLLLISRAITVGQKELGVPIFNNPVKQVTLPKEPAHRDRVLTETERLGLYKACENNPIYFMRSFVELLFETLCRRQAKNKKIFHGKPVAIDVKDLSKGIINPAPVVVKAPDFRKKVDPDLLKGVGYLLGSIPEDFKN